MNSGALFIGPDLRIPRSELEFRASRAGGPGGQHVNKTATRIELVWNVRHSWALSSEQRARLVQKLGARLDREGSVRVVASEFRSQTRNRDQAEERLTRLLRKALVVPKVRRPTRPSVSGMERRLKAKRELKEKKRERRARDFD